MTIATPESAGIDWRTIGKELSAWFAADQIEWRVQTDKTHKAEPNARVKVVAYIDARAVAQRLDDVVGCGAWSFDWSPINTDAKGDVTHAKGTITIHGVSKSDLGTSSSFDASKGCISDALKRAAVLWGVGRHLYTLPSVWVQLDAKGAIPETELTKLRAAVQRRINAAAA